MNRYEVDYIRIMPGSMRYPVKQIVTANSETEAIAYIKKVDVNPVIINSIRKV